MTDTEQKTNQENTKRMNIIVVEHDGLESRSFVLNFVITDAKITDTDSLRDAVRKACTEYAQTEEGKKTLDYNCGCFNWADFEANVPQDICEKYGFRIDNSNIIFGEVNWDEHLVDDELLEHNDEDREDME